MSYIGNTPFTAAFLTDTFSGDGSDTTFTLSAAPANTSSIIVAVSGVLQDPSTYSVSGTTLTFSAAPPTGTDNISVRFLGIPASGVTTTAYRTVTEFTATAGQTSFSVPSYTAGYVDVSRNGVMLGTADFTATSGTTVVLASGATAGDLIRVESFYVSSVLNAIPATAGAVNNSYLGALSTITTPSGVLTVPDTTATLLTSASSITQNAGPAFNVWRNGNVGISQSTWTKILLNAVDYNIESGWDTGNYKFIPSTAGYYQISVGAYHDYTSAAAGSIQVAIYKNGSAYAYNRVVQDSAAYNYGNLAVSRLIYFNGSTDYVELYVSSSNTSPQINGASVTDTWMTGALVRAA